MDVTTEADAPPRKPKQAFLKRGEGVKRRIDAYKYRRPLAEGSKGIPGGQPAPSDQAQQSAAEHQHKEGHDRQPGHAGEVWDSSVPYSYRGGFGLWVTRVTHSCESPLLFRCLHAVVAVVQTAADAARLLAAGNGTTKAHSTEASSYNPQPAEEVSMQTQQFHQALQQSCRGFGCLEH